MENNLGDWRIEQPGENNQPQQPKQPQQDDSGILNTIGGYIPQPIKTGARLIAGPAARVAEQTLGRLGDIEQMATGAISATTGAQPAMFPGPLDIVEYLTGGTNGGPMNMSGQIFPTSGQLKEKVTNRLTGQATTATSKPEEKYQEIATDIAGLMTGNPKSIANIVKAVGLAGGGESVKQGVVKVSGSETLGDIAKTGIHMFGNLYGVRNQIKSGIKTAYDNVSNRVKGETVRFGKLESYIDKAINDLEGRSFKGKEELLNILKESKKGGARNPAKRQYLNDRHKRKLAEINQKYDALYEKHGVSKALVEGKDAAVKSANDEAKHLSKNLKQGNKVIDAEKLIKVEQDINGHLGKFMDDPAMKKDVVPALAKLRSEIGSNIGTLDKKIPGVMGEYLHAKEMFKTTQAQTWLTSWLNKNINIDKLNHPITKAVIHVAGHSGNIPAVIKGITGAVGAKHITNALELAFRNKTARSLYMKGIQQGLLGNSKGANKAFQHFDKYLTQNMPQESEGDWGIES